MASIEKRGSAWRVRMRIAGKVVSETFATKRDAQAWVNKTEADRTAHRLGHIPPGKTFGDLLDRYLLEVVPQKRSAYAEGNRIRRILRDEQDLAQVLLQHLGPEHLSGWRDRRSKQVSSAAVLRDWSTLSAACNVAIREWRWLQVNPFTHLRRPEQPPARHQQFTEDQINAVLIATEYDPEAVPDYAVKRVAAAFLFSLETGMRAGEICGLTWEHVHLERRVAHLPKTLTKNGTARDVPLSTEALRILRQMQGIQPSNKEPKKRFAPGSVFGLREGQRDALWRKIRDRAGILEGMHFHDARATALTRLARKLNPLELAKMAGHKDLKMLLNVYYREDASVIAQKLD